MAQFGHIVMRTAGLLTLGVIVLNSEEDRTLGSTSGGRSRYLRAPGMVRHSPRGRLEARPLIALKTLGVLGLLTLLAIYRGEPETAEFPFLGSVEDWAWLRTGWWGILGLIGWAYLTVALVTLVLGRRREWLMGAWRS